MKKNGTPDKRDKANSDLKKTEHQIKDLKQNKSKVDWRHPGIYSRAFLYL